MLIKMQIHLMSTIHGLCEEINEPFNDVIQQQSTTCALAIFYDPNEYRKGLISSPRGRNTFFLIQPFEPFLYPRSLMIREIKTLLFK